MMPNDQHQPLRFAARRRLHAALGAQHITRMTISTLILSPTLFVVNSLVFSMM